MGERAGVSVVKGEVSLLLSAIRRNNRWMGHGRVEEEQDPLIRALYTLQDILNHTLRLSNLNVTTYLKPFCEIVQSDDTTGPVTGMAISSLDKFLAYGFIDPSHLSSSTAVEALSEAVTHARFVGTNPASDEVVLMKILQVLRTLMLSPAGRLLSNESVCEIMQSCFRICFEMRLSELLRCFAESTLVDMVQLLFSRLPSLSEEAHSVDDTSPMDQTLTTPQQELPVLQEMEEETEEEESQETREPPVDSADSAEQPDINAEDESHDQTEDNLTNQNSGTLSEIVSNDVACASSRHKAGILPPHGLPCLRELLRFLISIINSLDRHNTDSLIAIGLNLISVVIECGSSHLCRFPALAGLVQDNLCKNLFRLLRHDNFGLFSHALRSCYLLLESCRQDLKLQLEMFMIRLMELIGADHSTRVPYERRELALEYIVQLCHMPHLMAELYVNFDCGLYSSNVFENITKLLSKNAFPTQGGIMPTHLLSLDALLAILHHLEHGHMTSHMIQQGRGASDQNTLPNNHSDLSNSAGIIFTTSDRQEVTSSLPHHSPEGGQKLTVSASFSAPSGSGFRHSDSLPAMTLTDMKNISRSAEIVGGEEGVVGGGGGKGKPASGRQMGVAMCLESKVVVVTGEEDEGLEVAALPSSKELLAVRQRKKLILAATEQFNKKPKQGISFLMEQKILSTPANESEIADFLLENPRLNKARIGEYIGDRKNAHILKVFVRKFSWRGVPLVDALRGFLESFRLPGESPIVERILETLSRHWLESNSDDLGKQFANQDAVHVLTYSIMMLNTDLHSNQVKKKMTLEEFIRNQRKTNNGENFPPEFLNTVYTKVKEEEIIMPDEHGGVVKENYLWKVLLHRSAGEEGRFLSVKSSEFDQDLFLLSWGPTVAALSYVFDKADEKSIVQRAVDGFSKCASVAARYELKEVFDNLIITLCKFTALLNTHESTSSLYFLLGGNPKVKTSIQTMFTLAHHHGNMLREGWKNLLDCLLTLFSAKLLPECMVEVSDFLHPDGKISLFHEDTPVRSDSSLLSSLYNYWLLSNDQSGKALTPSEIKARKTALKCIQECHPEYLFTESKFLRSDALLELVKALTFASRSPDQHESLGTTFDEDSTVFFMEQLVTVALENKDRIGLFWSDLSGHLARIIVKSHGHAHLLERTVVGLLHLASRLLGRHSSAIQLLSSLRVILTLPPLTSTSPSSHKPTRDILRQVASGLLELLQAHSSDLRTASEWSVVFSVMEFASTGLVLYERKEEEAVVSAANSSSTLATVNNLETVSVDTGYREGGGGGGVAMVPEGIPSEAGETGKGGGGGGGEDGITSDWVWVEEAWHHQLVLPNSFDLLSKESIPVHDPQAFFKGCECVAYLVRSDHFITVDNFSVCVHCVRHFVETASSKQAIDHDRNHGNVPGKGGHGSRRERVPSPNRGTPKSPKSETGEKPGVNSLTYGTASLRLLDLLDALYSKVGRIFDKEATARLQSELSAFASRANSARSENTSSKTEEVQGKIYCPEVDQNGASSLWRPAGSDGCSLLWHVAWCPILQGMAWMCCDSRKAVRQAAITYLQRALLAHELQGLTALEWFACFKEVFFPMLSRLLGEIVSDEKVSLEETRVRASNLLCKVFLQHLPSLSTQPSFSELWITVLDYMDKFLNLENSDLLYEAIPESLKNMLLVMSTQGIFDNLMTPSSQSEVESPKQLLWGMTWRKIETFLPNFIQELFPNFTPPTLSKATPTVAEDSHSEEKEVQNESLSSAVIVTSPPVTSPPMTSSPVTSPPVAVPAAVSRGDVSPPPAPNIGSPSHQSSITDAGVEESAESSFPITLHPPLPPTLTQHTPSTSPPSGHIPDPVLGPVLIPAAPPYSHSQPNGMELEQSNDRQLPVHISMPNL